ncbi:RagB/SusD family nutrient uptake outer membrane protein [Sphingobacterium hungaricum]|nr:RagB/SusD family nutrient uptake outer membrane protein [Sphingobacterium hungaricum]
MKNKIVLFFVVLITSSSCSSMLDVDSTRLVSEKNKWTSLEDARASILGVYALTKAALGDYNAHWLYGEMRTGEFISPNRQDLKAIGRNDLNASYPALEALSNWRRWYAVVNSANTFLERIHEIRAADNRYTENTMEVDIAQARFLRAFAYFYMVRIWGDVPLIASSREGNFEDMPKEDGNKILAWVEQELLAAGEKLPYRYSANDEQQQGDYYNENSGRWDGALVRKVTAYAILAHVAAWQSNYADAAAYSKFVLDNYSKASIGYISTSTLTNANGFFFNKNINHLLGFNYDWGHVESSFTGHIEELTLAAPVVDKTVPDMYLPKEVILDVFDEMSDERFSIDTLGNPVTENYFRNFNGRYPIFSKIKCIQGGIADPTFRIFSSATIITRLEDVTLLRAEALAALGESNGAILLLDEIRERRGLEKYTQAVNGDLIDAIFLERQRELMGEGHRWYDLVRYNRIKNNDPDFVNLIQSGGIYWPISKDIRNQNKKIVQNDYWK